MREEEEAYAFKHALKKTHKVCMLFALGYATWDMTYLSVLFHEGR